MKRSKRPQATRDLNDLLQEAIEIAVDAHCGQKDCNGEPYILHPLRMMLRGRRTEDKIVAVLHDVVEDSDWTIAKLRKHGFPEAILAAVDHLTKREGEEYEDFLERTMSDPISRRVKVLDLEDNMNVLRMDKIDDKAMKRLKKYHRAWHHIDKAT